ncbi:MAG: hypothetical protein IJ010_01245 [Ruminococcus sp.]|nr:hypothetical protein [Ruminococcus sp.]
MSNYEKASLIADKLRNIMDCAGKSISSIVLAEDILSVCTPDELEFYYCKIIG